MLLSSLLPSYVTFRYTILYSQNILTVEKVYYALLSKEKMRHHNGGSTSQAEGLIVCGRNQDLNPGKNLRDKLESRHAVKLCHFCKKKEHIRVGRYALKNRKKAASVVDKRKQLVNTAKTNFMEDRQSEEAFLVISNRGSTPCEELVLYLTYILHLCHNRDWFIIYEGVLKGAVIMGNDMPWKIVRVGTIRIEMLDGG